MRDFHVSSSFLTLLPLTFGWSGVAVFFVISGFCIHISFSRKPNWQDFLIRRFFRIYPPYFLAALLFALIVPWSRVSHNRGGAAQLGSHLLLLHNLHSNSFYGISPAFWSIAVEAQLYGLYFFLLRAVARWGWGRSLLGIALLEIALRSVASIAPVVSANALPLWFLGIPFLYWYSWCIGAALAEAYLGDKPLPFANHSRLVWAAAVLCCAFIKPLSGYSFLCVSVLTATAIAKYLQKGTPPLSWPAFVLIPLRATGLWSFSIYLLHQPLLGIVPRVTTKFLPAYSQPVPIFLLCLCLWLPIVALSAFWYRVFEVPSIALGKQAAQKALVKTMLTSASPVQAEKLP